MDNVVNAEAGPITSRRAISHDRHPDTGSAGKRRPVLVLHVVVQRLQRLTYRMEEFSESQQSDAPGPAPATTAPFIAMAWSVLENTSSRFKEDWMALGQVSPRWQYVSNAARQRWDRLSQEDVTDVRGNAERLVTLLQWHYGLARDQALKELTDWRESLARPSASDGR